MISFFITKFLPTRFQRMQDEIERLIRFIIIGGLSFLMYFGLYALISRWLWITGNRSLQNFLAVCITSIFNYLAHRAWTFRSQGNHLDQMWRYLMVAVSATLLQSGLFWLGHVYLGWYDFIVVVVVAVLVPFYTYLLHRVFTFRH